MSAAALAAPRLAPRAGQDLASGIFASPIALASGFSHSEPANDTGENGVAYDEVTSESCYWTSKDPTRFRGGLNLYAYADNDPVNFVDRTGRHPEDGSDGGSAESDSPNSDNYDEDGGICANDDEDCKKACDEQYEADSEVCRSIKDPYQRKLCWEKAADDYAACLKKC